MKTWQQMSGEEQAQEITRRLGQLELIRQPYEGPWEDVITYVLPRFYDLKGEVQRGKKYGEDIYDGTACSALQLMADGLHGYLISPAMRWFSLKIPRFPATSQIPPVIKQWLEDCEECMYAAFLRSNFYESMSEYFIDGGGLGTAVMYSEEDLGTGRIVFTPTELGECFIAEDRHGQVDTLFRKFKLSARQAVQKFGLDVWKDLDISVANAYENSPYQEFEFVHAVFPNADRNPQRKDRKNKRFLSVWLKSGNASPCKVSGFDQFPFTVWRWRKRNRMIYGTSPAMDALMDILRLNIMAKDILDAAHMAIWPPLNVPADLRGQVNYNPRGYNYVKGRDNNRITAINTVSNYPVGVDREEKVQQAVREVFKVDFFLMLAQAEKVMTATEIIEKQGEKAAVLGTTIGRLNSECLNPIIDRVWQIEMDAHRMPMPPPELVEMLGGQDIEVDYMGPLAQAQKRLFRMRGVQASLEAMVPLIKVNPEIADNVDWDEVAREILEADGMPAKAVRTADQVQAIRQGRAQQIEQAKQIEVADRAASHLPTLLQGVDQNSVASMVASMMQGQQQGISMRQ